MEGEQHHYELRSRSRSRSQTPQVLNRSLNDELPEHHYDLRSRSRERSHTPGEVTSSRRSGSRSLPGSMDKSADKNMETILEQKEEAVTQNQDNQTTKAATAKKVERRSERQRAKRQIFANGRTETNENKSNTKMERERQSLTPRRIFTSDYSSEEGEHEEKEERDDPPSRPGSAYEIYKQAGDWWNVFPKTDYTYSQKSQFRYEIAPGVLAMPNMSRRSIHSDSNSTLSSIPSTSPQNLSQTSTQVINKFDSQRDRESTDKELMATNEETNSPFLSSRYPDSAARGKVYKSTHVEQYSSRREVIYSSSGTTSSLQSLDDRYGNYALGSTNLTRRYEPLSQADSDIDIDDTISTVDGHRRLYRQRQENEMNLFMRIYSRFISIVITSYTSVKNFVGLGEQRRSYQGSYSFRREEESRWSKIQEWFSKSSQYLYTLLVNLLFLDTWLLSRVESLRERLPNRRSKLIWLVLLPLLVLGDSLTELGNQFAYLGWHLNGLWLLAWILSCLSDLAPIYDGLASLVDGFASRSSGIWEYITYPATAISVLFHAAWGQSKMDYNILTSSSDIPAKTPSLLVGDSSEVNVAENYGWKEDVYDPEELRRKDSEMEKKIDTIVAMFVERIEKIEDHHKNYNDDLAKLERAQSITADDHAGLRADLQSRFNDMNERLDDIDAIKTELRSLREMQSKIKSCCNDAAAIPVIEIEKHVNHILAGYFRDETDDNDVRPVSSEHLARTIKNLFVAKTELETRIASINSTLQSSVQDVKDLANKVMIDVTNQMNANMLTRDDGSGGGDDGGLTKEDVARIVRNALKIYDADKTGRVDYALESSGGQIISTRCTQAYGLKTRAYKIFGYTLYYENSNARTVIQGKPIQPGNCWVFQDFPGYLLIKLRTLIKITGFTLEHAPRSTLPNGEMRSAPRKFDVLGYDDENDKDPVILGEYEFIDSDESLQYFPIQNTIDKPYEFVELRIHSNHGQIDYTCVYRFRVHGVPT